MRLLPVVCMLVFVMGLGGVQGLAAQATPASNSTMNRNDYLLRKIDITTRFDAEKADFPQLLEANALTELAGSVYRFLVIRDDGCGLEVPDESLRVSHVLWCESLAIGADAAIASVSGKLRNDAAHIAHANQLWTESYDLLGMSEAVSLP